MAADRPFPDAFEYIGRPQRRDVTTVVTNGDEDVTLNFRFGEVTFHAVEPFVTVWNSVYSELGFNHQTRSAGARGPIEPIEASR